MFCGGVPLVVGTAIFVAWLFTRADWLEIAGFITIFAGIGAVGIGTICLVVYIERSWRSREIERRRLVWQAVGTGALLLANFPAAAGAVVGAELIETCYTVTFTNQSDVTLESARVQGGGVNVSLGDVAPGATVKISFWVGQDGELVLTGKHGAAKVEATVEGYVTNGLGGDMIVVLDANGSVTVKDRRSGMPD
jgi:hypothetical protein